MVKGIEIQNIARSWIGTPWQHNQRCKGAGVDCVQLCAGVAEEYGLDVGRIENYYRVPEGDSLMRRLASVMTQKDSLDPKDIEVGNVLLFRVGGIPTHVGIASDIGLIHADMRTMRVVETRLGGWIRFLVAIYEVPDRP